MGNYITSQKVWKALGEDAYTRVRGETLGVANSTNSTTFSFEHKNIISGSTIIYKDGIEISGVSYNLDEGKVTISNPVISSTYSADYDYAGLPDSLIQDIISQSEEELELITGRSFIPTTTSEYLDVEEDQTEFFLKNYPVTRIIGVSTNTATSVTDEPVWEGRTEGLGNDYLTDGAYTNRIRFIDNAPYAGEHRLKVDYVYGDNNVLAQELALLLAERRLIQSGIYRAISKGQPFDEKQLIGLNSRIDQLTILLKRQNIEGV